ncbi:hybrid sensor histidine kinase/response regulator [Longimicrobium terrae]|uniref:histidine kinase n=1 Tax=Longimicrobium terrae TaxID=1639882 RepID=A0A841H4Y9_9BACT|nr:hybrid sensor histidine kinase/response regulator [Longimicrobium terrae]MBB4638799.1 signal transduction histidine kinase [Longimicrobium terrae]MBB6073038.1 signal transduction histidine kinase [Longimicrobium terrae]NNC33161.1 hybrid sensor histidine kinase/response regulator [Longimicrobium terrae]
MQSSDSPAVLLVEDYPPSRYATGRVLRQAGFTVREAENGIEGLRLARDCPDVIVLDINLPDVDGFEVCRRLKADPATRSIPVLQLSAARRGLEDRVQGLEGGADAYVAQPVEARELVATVNALLRMRRAEQEAVASRDLAEARAREAQALAGRLEVALEAAAAGNAAKGRFLATMSHEIRTPLNAIAGYVDLLLLEVQGPLTSLQADHLERVQRAQQHLLGLINDVLDYAKLEAGYAELQVEAVALEGPMRAAEAMVRPQAEAKGLHLEVRCGAPLYTLADAGRLRQVLLNLLGNAVKFTPAGGRVELWCEAEDASVRLHVRDTGMGIPAAFLAEIFEPFVQVDGALTRTQQGTGLGLAISRELARGMGGALTAVSTPASGSVFTLILPRAPEDGAG